MNAVKISWKGLRHDPFTLLLNILLITFGIGILTMLLLATRQLSNKLKANAKDIDLVVGAKGSPLQLILSSIYYVDFPTGNISLQEAEIIARSPLVKRMTPLALGDNFNGFRIVGTDYSFVQLYGLELAQGKFWNKDFDVTIGSAVADAKNLKVGDRFYGAHGLSSIQDEHTDHPFVITGILASQGNVTDNLVLTNISSIWKMHGQEVLHHDENEATTTAVNEHNNTEKEITSLLVQYRSPMSVVLFPRMVNKTTNMQAASPALESARLFSLVGIGVDTLQWFSYFIMFIAAISIFISLYNSLKERQYDLAVMRTMGASRKQLFLIVISEGILLALIGSVLGILSGHLCLEVIGSYQESTQAKLTGSLFLWQEIYLLFAGFFIGWLAAVLPAIQAYRSDISKILSKH